MTIIEKFMDFVQKLPADRAQSLEDTLEQIMTSWSGDVDFSPEQLAEMDRRMAEDRPNYASQENITAIFGKPFSA